MLDTATKYSDTVPVDVPALNQRATHHDGRFRLFPQYEKTWLTPLNPRGPWSLAQGGRGHV